MQSLSARPALLPGQAIGSAQRRPARSRAPVTRAQADDASVPVPWRGAMLGALAATSLVRELGRATLQGPGAAHCRL